MHNSTQAIYLRKDLLRAMQTLGLRLRAGIQQVHILTTVTVLPPVYTRHLTKSIHRLALHMLASNVLYELVKHGTKLHSIFNLCEPNVK